jgi:hypothetical protein
MFLKAAIDNENLQRETAGKTFLLNTHDIGN